MADNDTGTGSGRGGPMGTPSAKGASPDVDQEQNAVVSGGGLVGEDDDQEPSNEAERSPSSQAPDED